MNYELRFVDKILFLLNQITIQHQKMTVQSQSILKQEQST